MTDYETEIEPAAEKTPSRQNKLQRLLIIGILNASVAIFLGFAIAEYISSRKINYFN